MSCSLSALQAYDNKFVLNKDFTYDANSITGVKMEMVANRLNNKAEFLEMEGPIINISRGVDTITINFPAEMYKDYQDLIEDYLDNEKNISQNTLNKLNSLVHNFTNPVSSSELSESYKEYLENQQAIELDGEGLRNENITDNHTPENNSNMLVDNKYMDWKRRREELLEKVREKKYQMNLKGAPAAEKKEINILIDTIQKELADFKNGDISSIMHHLEAEIKELKLLYPKINASTEDTLEAAKLLDLLEVKDRLALLKDIFVIAENEEAEILKGNIRKNMNEALEETFGDFKSYDAFRSAVVDLEDIKRKTMGKIIFGIIMNNDLVEDNRAHFASKGKEEAFNEFVEKIGEIIHAEEGDHENFIDGGKLSSIFLGASSYDSILSELVYLTKDAHTNREIGIISSAKEKINKTYGYLSKQKFNGNFLMDEIMEVGEFGEQTSSLISHYNNSEDVQDSKNTFYTNRRNMYVAKPGRKRLLQKSIMNNLLKNAEIFQLNKIKSFVDSHKDNEYVTPYSTYSEAEMESYEKELREKMGNIAFEIELKKHTKSFTNFLSDTELRDNMDFENPIFIFEELSKMSGKSKNIRGNPIDPNDQTSGELATLEYIHFTPSSKDINTYDTKLKSIEKENIPGFNTFYDGAHDIIEYYTTTAKTEGIILQHNSIHTLQDSLSRAAVKELSTFKKVSKSLYEGFKAFFSSYFDFNSVENRENRKNFISGKEFNTKMSSYGIDEVNKQARIMSGWDMEELNKEAEKVGLNKYIFDESKLTTKAILTKKKKFARAIATQKLNKSVSMDIQKRLFTAADISVSVNARRNTLSTLEVAKEYATHKGADNTATHLEHFGANNVLQVGDRDFGNKLNRFERLKLVPRVKYYTESEKDLKALLEKERKNLEGKYPVKFVFGDTQYEYDEENDSFTKVLSVRSKDGSIVTEKIELHPTEKNRVLESYDKYLVDAINNIGTGITAGSLLKGMMGSMFRTTLTISGISGAMNRLAGIIQNDQAAASGLYGFNTEVLAEVRAILRGSNSRRYIKTFTGSKALGLSNTKDALAVEVLAAFMEKLRALDSVNKDDTFGDGSASFISSTKDLVSKISDFSMDFAMNNAEFHNQSELFLAMASQIMVPTNMIDSSGNTISKPLFDLKTKEWIFKSATDLSLKDEFNTTDNQDNWVNLRRNSNNQAPQAIFVNKYKNLRDKLHGNYRTDDKIMAQSTMLGKSMIVFMKWFFENTNNQYGTKKASIATGEIGLKGRKIALLNNKPALVTHLVAKNLITTGGIIGAIGGSMGVVPLVIGGVASVSLITYLYRANKISLDGSLLDFNMYASYASEIAARTTRKFLNSTIPFGRKILSNKLNDSEIDRMIRKIEKTPSDQELSYDRKLISESAQELANKANLVIQFTIYGLLLKALAILAFGGSDEEDEKALADIEGYLNKLNNMMHRGIADIDKWTDPFQLKESLGLAFYESIGRNVDNVTKSIKKYNDGKATGEEASYSIAFVLLGAFFKVPGSALKMASPDKSYFKDKKVYEKDIRITFFNDLIQNAYEPTEKIAKTAAEKLRARYRTQTKDFYRDNIIDSWEKSGKKFTEEELDKMVESNLLRDLNSMGLYKNNKKDFTYLKAIEGLNITEQINKTLSGDRKVNTTKQTSGKKSVKGNSKLKSTSLKNGGLKQVKL